jgi:signal transduction histidine kinase
LTITDDGCGLQPAANSDGMGQRIMRYRAERAAATLSIKNGRQNGVVVTCRFSQGGIAATVPAAKPPSPLAD